MTRWSAVALSASLAWGSVAGAREPDHRVSPEGRTFRTRFDPASRAWIGWSGSASGASGAVVANSELHAGVAFRTRDEDARPDRVVWQLGHRALAGYVAPFVTAGGKLPALDVGLYALSVHRHDPSPRLVVPTSPPVGIPFPFDTGIELEVAHAWAPRRITGDGFGRLTVARATAFIDPWRSGSAGRSLEIGLGVRHDVDVHGALFSDASAPLAGTRVVHRIAPMTATSITFRYQTLDGLTAIDARAELVPHWVSAGGWAVSASAFALAERTLLAVNDVPMSVFVHGEVRTIPGTDHVPSIGYTRISVGIVVGYPLR